VFLVFINIIAWIIGVLATIVFAYSFFRALTYPNSTEEMFDVIRTGYKSVYRPARPFIIALICWAWIIAGWLT
jgi:hypothetical protein